MIRTLLFTFIFLSLPLHATDNKIYNPQFSQTTKEGTQAKKRGRLETNHNKKRRNTSYQNFIEHPLEEHERIWKTAHKARKKGYFRKAYNLYQNLFANPTYPLSYRVAAQRQIVSLYAHHQIDMPLTPDTSYLLKRTNELSDYTADQPSNFPKVDHILLSALTLKLYILKPECFYKKVDVEFELAWLSHILDESLPTIRETLQQHLSMIQDLLQASS